MAVHLSSFHATGESKKRVIEDMKQGLKHQKQAQRKEIPGVLAEAYSERDK